jgi:hypothetical protein
VKETETEMAKEMERATAPVPAAIPTWAHQNPQSRRRTLPGPCKRP